MCRGRAGRQRSPRNTRTVSHLVNARLGRARVEEERPPGDDEVHAGKLSGGLLQPLLPDIAPRSYLFLRQLNLSDNCLGLDILKCVVRVLNLVCYTVSETMSIFMMRLDAAAAIRGRWRAWDAEVEGDGVADSRE